MELNFIITPITKINSNSGYTIIEILTSVTILSILVALGLYSYTPALNAVNAIQCSSRMRTIHSALASSLADNGFWPQPTETSINESLDDWWIKELTPYGVTQKTWICPTIVKNSIKAPENLPSSSYAVSLFEKSPTAPYQWAQQPWLIEVAGNHPQGPHICFPDGSVKNLNQLLKK